MSRTKARSVLTENRWYFLIHLYISGLYSRVTLCLPQTPSLCPSQCRHAHLSCLPGYQNLPKCFLHPGRYSVYPINFDHFRDQFRTLVRSVRCSGNLEARKFKVCITESASIHSCIISTCSGTVVLRIVHIGGSSPGSTDVDVGNDTLVLEVRSNVAVCRWNKNSKFALVVLPMVFLHCLTFYSAKKSSKCCVSSSWFQTC